MPAQDYPESASVEWIDQYGNHRLRYWHPVTYYQVTDRILGTISSHVPLSDRAVGPREMPRLFTWLKDHIKKSAQKVISSTVDEIEVTKKDDKQCTKRAKKRKG